MTPYASRKVDISMAIDYIGEIDVCSQSCFNVAIRPGVGNVNKNVLVQLLDKVVRCSCCYFDDVGSPFVLVLFALKPSCRITSMVDYFNGSWKSLKFSNAYFKKAKTSLLPIVLKDLL